MGDTVEAQRTLQGIAGHRIDLWACVWPWEHNILRNMYFEHGKLSIDVGDSVCLNVWGMLLADCENVQLHTNVQLEIAWSEVT